MYAHQVRNPSHVLAYVIDCTLATVCDLAMKKSRSEYEFKRQKAIAQKAIQWATEFGVDLSSTRAKDVTTTVDEWAAHFDVKRKG